MTPSKFYYYIFHEDRNWIERLEDGPYLVLGMLGWCLFGTAWIYLIKHATPVFGGGYWYLATIGSPIILILTLEIAVPIFSDRNPVGFLEWALVVPGFLLIWIPWVFIRWGVRTYRCMPISRGRATWAAYWKRRRAGRDVPRAEVRRSNVREWDS